jgi:chromosome segregation ATPase
MASLSSLNKQEREIKGKITKLRKQFREKKISKKQFDKGFEDNTRQLEDISKQKSELIGEPLPPLPPPPAKPKSHGFGLDAIKRSILGDDKPPKQEKPDFSKDLPEPPAPPKLFKKEVVKKVEVPVVKEKIREVPVFKEKIKEVPVVKERIREVKVPVIKERIKRVEVPVIKEIKVPIIKEKIRTVEVPSKDPALARRIEESVKELNNLRLDVARQGQEFAQMARDISELKKQMEGYSETRAQVKSLKANVDKIDFQELSQEIYAQFEKMKSSIKESEKKTDDVAERLNVELKTVKEQLNETKQAGEAMKDLDVSSMRRDVESLKQKSAYIEQHIERVDIRPVIEMIKDVENKVEGLRTSSALIIE